MLFHSSIRKELARTFGATLVVLITIVMTIILIRTLGQASRGTVNPSEVMMVMGFSVLGYLPVLLTLSLFISIVGTLSRMYGDSEMVIRNGTPSATSCCRRPPTACSPACARATRWRAWGATSSSCWSGG